MSNSTTSPANTSHHIAPESLDALLRSTVTPPCGAGAGADPVAGVDCGVDWGVGCVTGGDVVAVELV